MRLLNTSTKKLKSFLGDSTPSYAILSHTWGEDELTLQDLEILVKSHNEDPSHPLHSTSGYQKIDGCCALAKNNGFEWVWIDTCNIDKTSSAELSEAINSMFRWYKKATVCYVYLSDVDLPTNISAKDSTFRKSRWFTRGWTLQELMAPDVVQFYDRSWNLIGERSALLEVITEVTGISPQYFLSESLYNASVAQRMSWVARRQTTRVEDMAYCLLGMFDVNMPLLYGEGIKAFRRLQEEIIKQSNDQSIFAWAFGQLSTVDGEGDDSGEGRKDEGRGGDGTGGVDKGTGPLAQRPSDFVHCGKVILCDAWESPKGTGFEKVKAGIRIDLPVVFEDALHHLYKRFTVGKKCGPPILYGLLNCRLMDNFTDLIAIPMQVCDDDHQIYSKNGLWNTQRLRRIPPILYNYALFHRKPAFYTITMVEGRFMSRTVQLARSLALLHPTVHRQISSSILIEELGNFAHISSRMSPAHLLSNVSGLKLLNDITPSGLLQSALAASFIQYKTTFGLTGAEECFILRIQPGKMDQSGRKFQFRVALSPTDAILEELSPSDLNQLNWKENLQGVNTKITVKKFSPMNVLDMRAYVVSLTCTTLTKGIVPQSIIFTSSWGKMKHVGAHLFLYFVFRLSSPRNKRARAYIGLSTVSVSVGLVHIIPHRLKFFFDVYPLVVGASITICIFLSPVISSRRKLAAFMIWGAFLSIWKQIGEMDS